MRTLIRKVDASVARLEYLILMLLMAALTLILTAQVILRYFFSSPLFWAEEVAVQILIATTFIGVSYLLYSAKLVRVDFILLHLNTKLYWLVERILQLITLLVLGVICYFATEWILDPMTRIDVSPTTQLPRWYNYALLVASFYCMVFHQLVKLLLPVEKGQEFTS